MSLIDPRTLKGFRDYPPALMIPRERILETARRVYRSYGFAPIDTPALEYAEVLLGKGGGDNDRLVYRFRDHGDRDVALRFDLTVPFARFAAQHIGQLGTPFKRYHMGPVWRGENTAHGRYREFWQCDFDTIGTTANAADVEVALVIHDLMAALSWEFGFDGFQVRINNRLVLNGLLEELGLSGQSVQLLRSLDKLPKIGAEKVADEMGRETGVSREMAQRILDLAGMEGTNQEILDRVHAQYGENARTAEGITRLRELVNAAATAGIPEGRIQIDLSICRGLDYYTGTIFETFLTQLPGIGSVCSGGRYDNLASLYTKQQLPGVGASLGLDRLLAALEEMKLLTQVSTPATVIVLNLDATRLGDYQRIARNLRSEGIGVEVYPDARKLGQQFQYAEKRGFRIALIAGGDEFGRGEWKVKDLRARTEETVAESDVVEKLRSALR